MKNRGTAVSCPGSIQLRFDGVNVTGSATISCTTSEGAGATVTYQPPSILLRRLACPAMPPDNEPANATYNPYITVDYMENVPVWHYRSPNADEYQKAVKQVEES